MRTGATAPHATHIDAWDIDPLIDAAAASCHGLSGRRRPRRDVVDMLVEGPPVPAGDDPDGPALVDQALGNALLAAITEAWRLHWQPANIPRVLARTRGNAHAQLAAEGVVRQTSRYRHDELPPRWRSQIDAIDPGVRRLIDDDRWALPPHHPLTERAAALVLALETLGTLRALPPLPKIGPIPGERPPARHRAVGAPSHVDSGVLHRVMSLLAKAESTTFPEEAEALTAKAQELMARHAIDAALIAASNDARDRGTVGGRRIGIDDPYAKPKTILLGFIARANRCRAVWSRDFGFATVFGDDVDLDTVELLYTSLLVQSSRAMIAASPPGQSSSAARTRSFRQSFLVSFATRIGQRLEDAVASAVTHAQHDYTSDLLPVLADREAAADAACRAAFPSVRSFSASANDLAGWQAGRQAADRAQLDLHNPVEPTTSRRELRERT
jgi:hypothetical protein